MLDATGSSGRPHITGNNGFSTAVHLSGPAGRRYSDTWRPTGAEWRILWTGWSDAAWNMATDEWLMVTAAERPPTLRVYGWRHPTISLGRHEAWRRVVRLDGLQAAGVQLVRRPTGGRAVLHYRELTYSVTAATGDSAVLGDRLEETMSRVASALGRFVSGAGIDVQVQRRSAPVKRQTGPCFETASRFELLGDGCKMVGNAQLRTPQAFLQHGSIPIFPSVSPLRKLGPESTARGSRREASSTPLSGWAGCTLDHLGRELAEAFGTHFGARLVWEPSHRLRSAEIGALAAARYRSPKWTFRR